MAVFTNKVLPRSELFGVTLLGEAAAVTEIARRGTRLTAEQIARVRTELDRLFPPMTTGPIDVIEAPDTSIPEPVLPADIRASSVIDFSSLDNLTTQQIQDALLEGIRKAPIEEWMAFLDPAQARLVRRNFNGPSRIRGAAGTGKTVVALHRAAYLARTMEGRVLVTTYVRTLPRVMAALMERLAPDVVDRIDFRSVHQFARDVLVQRGVPVVIDDRAADRIFKDLWEREGKSGPLGKIDPAPPYWQDEIAHVLKGRGLTPLRAVRRASRARDAAGRSAARCGPRSGGSTSPTRKRSRSAASSTGRRRARGRELAGRDPLRGYAAVVVDEAQDLSCAMIRMLHSVVGDAPDGLNLVGDGQQTIYPGGFNLAEAGVAISGSRRGADPQLPQHGRDRGLRLGAGRR